MHKEMTTLHESDLTLSLGPVKVHAIVNVWLPKSVYELINDGETDENYLTDHVFFERHPERKRRRIGRDERGAIHEWHTIRTYLIRPLVQLVRQKMKGYDHVVLEFDQKP